MVQMIEDYYQFFDKAHFYEKYLVKIADVEVFLKDYVFYFLVAINLTGNLMNIFIFTRPPFRHISIGFLLLLVSLSDILSSMSLIYYALLDSLGYNDIQLAANLVVGKVPIIYALFYLYISVPFMTPIISTFIALDRCLATLKPALIPKLNSKRLQITVVLSSIGVFFLINCVIFFEKFISFQTSYVSIDTIRTNYIVNVYSYINILFACVLPFLTMCVANVCTVLRIKESKMKFVQNAAVGQKRQHREDKFLAMSISLNILFLVFYLPRYSIEAVRFYYVKVLLRNEMNLYYFVFCDKMAIISDYWKYFYSTFQFIVYIITNSIYRKEFKVKITQRLRKFFLILVPLLFAVVGCSLAVFYIVTLNKIGYGQFCLSKDQCQMNMLCKNAKCICNDETVLKTDATCATTGERLSRDLKPLLLNSSKPDVQIKQPEIAYASFRALTSVQVARVNGKYYYYAFDSTTGYAYIYNEKWKYDSFLNLKVSQFSNTGLCFTGGSIIICKSNLFYVCGSLHKFDLKGNLIKSYNKFIDYFDVGCCDTTKEEIYAVNNENGRISVFDFDLSKVSYFSSTHNKSTGQGSHFLAYHKNRLYASYPDKILVFENQALVDSIPFSRPRAIQFDDYDNVLISSSFIVQLRDSNLAVLANRSFRSVFDKDNDISAVGFDRKNNIVITCRVSINIFN